MESSQSFDNLHLTFDLDFICNFCYLLLFCYILIGYKLLNN